MEGLPYVDTFDSFVQKHPEINADWRETVAPVVDETEHQFYAFIMSYIYM